MTAALCMWSGGIDSTGLLYWLLQETDHEVVVHHVAMQNTERRWRAEARAIEKCRDWFEENCRPFAFTESSYSMSGVTAPPDHGVLGFMAAQVANRLEVDIVCMGSMHDDNSLRGIQERRELRDRVYDATLIVDPKPILSMPLLQWTKQQIYEYLPETLRKKAWSCRTPVLMYSPCGLCRACRELEGVSQSPAAMVRNRPSPHQKHAFLQLNSKKTT